MTGFIKRLIVLVIVNCVINLQKYFSNILGFILDSSLFFIVRYASKYGNKMFVIKDPE